nr:hypothetical protein [Brevibacterium aurantiacum]
MSATYQPVLDKLDPYPACLQTNAFDIIAYNSSYRFLFTDMNQIPPPERNCALQFFTDEEWRSRYIDDEVVASRMVAQLRSAVGSSTNSGAGPTIKELQLRSDEFAELWRRHDVLFQHLETKRLDSPVVGELNLNFVTTNVAETGYRLTMMTPADETTSQRLTQLSELTVDAGI